MKSILVVRNSTVHARFYWTIVNYWYVRKTKTKAKILSIIKLVNNEITLLN